MITLDLPAELEARLTAEAEARGLDLAAYAARVLAEAIPAITGRTRAVAGSITVEATSTVIDDWKPPRAPEEAQAWLDRLAQFSHKIPAMPGETFSREMIYQNHD